MNFMALLKMVENLVFDHYRPVREAINSVVSRHWQMTLPGILRGKGAVIEELEELWEAYHGITNAKEV